MNTINRWMLAGLVSGCIAIIGTRHIFEQQMDGFTLGIIQTASHPALDTLSAGCTEELKLIDTNINIIKKNAQGSINNAHIIAQQFHANHQINAILAIGTPAAQAIVAVEQEKPIIFAAVTDPHEAGLINHQMTNVCGVTDMIDTEKQIELACTLLPQINSIAFVFNKGEINAQTMVQLFEKSCAKRNIKTSCCAVINEAEIASATLSACKCADLIITPIDNTVASTIPLITSIAQKQQIPLIVSDNLLVKFGALAACGVNYHEAGKKAARLIKVLLQDGKKPHELTIVQPECTQFVVNSNVAEALNIAIPDQVADQTVFIKTKGNNAK